MFVRLPLSSVVHLGALIDLGASDNFVDQDVAQTPQDLFCE